MRIDGLLGVFPEGGEVHAHALPGVHQKVGPDRVIRIHMLVLHKPAFFITTDRENSQTKIIKPFLDLLQKPAVTGVSGKVDPAGR